jgi:MFS family permease
MKTSAYGWRSHYTLLVLLFVYTMSFIDRQIMGILIQPIKEEFQVSDTAMGLLSGLTFALFYGVLAIPFGRYADRANRRNFVAYCCAAWSAMTALCGMATGYWSLALARVGVAVGEAGGTAPSLSMIADHYPPEQRGRAMGVYWLGPQLGILFGLTLGGWIAQHHGWRAAFLWMAAPGILAALMLRYTSVEPRRGMWDGEAPPVSGPVESLGVIVRSLWASKVFMRIGLAGLLMGFTGYGIGIWTPSFLVRSHGMSLQGAGAVMGLLGGTAAALGALLGGWLCDTLAKRDPRWRIGVPLLGCLLSLPTGLGFYLMPAGDVWHLGSLAMPAAVGWYLLFGVTAVWWVAPVYAVLSELIAPHRRATALSIFSLGLTMVGGGLGPLLVGLLSDALTPWMGTEALRMSLAITTGSCFALGIAAFAWAIKAYADERLGGAGGAAGTRAKG